jgi:hypothetical protein
MLRLVPLLLAALLLAGCDDGDERAATSTSYTLEVERAGLPKRLAPGECFAAVPGVVVLGRAVGGPAGCRTVAARYFGARHRLRWPPALLRGPDSISECTLRRGSAVLAVVRHDDPNDDRAFDLATRMCEGLRHDGWRAAPLDDLVDS